MYKLPVQFASIEILSTETAHCSDIVLWIINVSWVEHQEIAIPIICSEDTEDTAVKEAKSKEEEESVELEEK